MIRKTLYTILMLISSCFVSAQSVSTNSQLKLMNYALTALEYNYFVSNEDFKTMMILPSDDGMLSYIDPVSYGQTISQKWKFYFDESNHAITAGIFLCEYNEKTGNWEEMDSIGVMRNKDLKIMNDAIRNRLEDLLKNIIIKGDYEADKLYYKTMGNMVVRIDGVNKGNAVYGPHQIDSKSPLQITESFVDKGCRVLVVNGPVMGSRKSVEMVLREKPEFSNFLEIMYACECFSSYNSKDNCSSVVQSGNMLSMNEDYFMPSSDKYLLDDFHYTIYAPTNTAMEKAFSQGLPNLEDYSEALKQDDYLVSIGEVANSAYKIRSVWFDFIKYHIQDYSVFVDKETKSRKYNTAINALVKVEGNTYYSIGKPYQLTVEASNSELKITDALGNVHNVNASTGLYNIIANEYWVDGTLDYGNNKRTENSMINSSSTVVIHAIDTPLMFSSEQFKYKFDN